MELGAESQGFTNHCSFDRTKPLHALKSSQKILIFKILSGNTRTQYLFGLGRSLYSDGIGDFF
jgi:hypothetical protein